MHDIRSLREDPNAFVHELARRGVRVRVGRILELDRQWRFHETEAQKAQADLNRLSRDIGLAMRQTQSRRMPDLALKLASPDQIDISNLVKEAEATKAKQATAAETAAHLRDMLDELLARLPNLPARDVPDGLDETSNKLIRKWRRPRRFNFSPLSHEAIGEKLRMMDFASAAKLSGSRFVVLKGPLARLERALAQFMLDLHVSKFGYTEISPPYLVRKKAAYGTGNLPKSAQEMFKTTNGMWLIPTAEMPLTNLVSEEILEDHDLPMRFTAWTPSFRSEAGAAGRDTRGMIRVHQFHKVELVSITRPEDSVSEHERMTQCAEEVLKRLGLAYRVMLLSCGDMGFAAEKTYDLEVWLPGQNAYREISSCSNCGAFQARRMNARYRPAGEKGTRPAYVHTLNGSGLAVGRTLIAILENYQQQDGTVMIPRPLRRYMDGQEVIEPNG